MLLTQAEHQDYFNKCQLGGSQEPEPLALKEQAPLTLELIYLLADTLFTGHLIVGITGFVLNLNSFSFDAYANGYVH